MMSQLLLRRSAALLLTLVLASPAGRSAATPVAQVDASIDSVGVQSSGTSALDTGAVGPDAQNFARAVANPFAGTVGVSVATNLLGGTVPSLQAHTAASLQENWTAETPNQAFVDCRSIVCSATLQFNLHGILSPNFGTNSPNFGGLFEQIDVGNVEIQVQANQPSAGVFGVINVNGADVSTFGVPVTVLADGSLLIDDTVSLQTGLGSMFASNTYLSADWSGEGFIAEPTAVNFLDTSSFSILSSDPNIIWTSDSGRTSTAVDIPPSSVPEPGTLALMGIGLAGITAMRKRQTK